MLLPDLKIRIIQISVDLATLHKYIMGSVWVQDYFIYTVDVLCYYGYLTVYCYKCLSQPRMVGLANDPAYYAYYNDYDDNG